MNELRLYELAYTAAVIMWGREHEILENIPDNEIAKEREKRAWEELEEISAKLRELESKETY